MLKDYLRTRAGKTPGNLGRIVAEQDPELNEYYVDSDRYVTRALTPEDPVVFFVGPKGAGKSAILQMVRLTRTIDQHRIISISPDDLAFSALANVKAKTPIITDSSSHQWLFKSLWDYILALEVLRREFKDQNTFASHLKSLLSRLFGSGRETEARRLLLVSLGDEGQSMSLSDRILQLVNEIELSAELPENARLSATAKIDTSKVGQGGQLWLLSLINNVAKKIHETIKSPYHILIDDLVLHWSDTAVQNAFIAALFYSLRHFNRPPYLRCSVAIRDQIFRRLPLIDRDKYYDWICNVEWQEASVKKMVERRITKNIDVLTKDIWGGLFPANAFQRLIRHTYGRPREAIRLTSMAVAEAVKHNHLRVEDTDLTSAIKKFSDHRVIEISSEFAHARGGLEYVIRKFKGWNKEFPVSQLKELADDVWLEKECRIDVAQSYLWVADYTDEPAALATILLEYSIILFKPHREAAPILYDLDAKPQVTVDTWVAMHPAFWAALDMEAAVK